MMRWFQTLFVFSSLVVAPALAATPAPPVAAPHAQFRIKHGDDLRWAARDWDDRDWPTVDAKALPAHSGIYWVRWHTQLGEATLIGGGPDTWQPERNGPVDAIAGAVVCAFDFYWDGRLVLRNGTVGSSPETEVPGTLEFVARLPDDLRGPGPHVAAIRISSYQVNFPGSTVFSFPASTLNYDRRNSDFDRQVIFPMLGTSCALVAAVVCGVLFWLVDRRRPLLLCGFFSLAVAVYHFLVGWRYVSVLIFRPETYDQLYPRYQAIELVITLIAWPLPLMFLEQFAFPRKRWWLAALGVLLAAVWWTTWNGSAYVNVLWQCRAALGVTTVVAGWAVARRRTGARLALAAALIGLASVHADSNPPLFLAPTFLLTFALLVMALLTAVGLQVQTARRVARAAELTAARMEIELLKKNLQPHFLMNTLTALSEVVEQDPRGAVKLIDDLAEEFRTVARVSAEKLIPLAHELDLCRAHLRVMSVRTGRTWSFDAARVDEAALVPPAVFLTLIENGFAHQRVTEGAAAFTLQSERAADGMVHYTFFSPGEVQTNSTRPAGGTGLRYVKARLEESFPGQWSLRGETVAGGWQTVIEINDRAEGGRA